MYHAAVGPDPCTGLGSPIGRALAALLVSGQAQPAPSQPSAPGTIAPAAPSVDRVIAWAESQLPKRGFITPATAKKLVERGLRKSYPSG